MELDRIRLGQAAVGDLLSIAGRWVLVAQMQTAPGQVELVVADLVTELETHHAFTDDTMVLRGDPAIVHRADEFLGMTMQQAEAWAAALGWECRDKSLSGYHNDDLRHDRINVWTDNNGRVIRAEMG